MDVAAQMAERGQRQEVETTLATVVALAVAVTQHHTGESLVEVVVWSQSLGVPNFHQEGIVLVAGTAAPCHPEAETRRNNFQLSGSDEPAPLGTPAANVRWQCARLPSAYRRPHRGERQRRI